MTRVVHLEGLTPYAWAHDLQARLVDARRRELDEDVILMLTHPPTITTGRRTTPQGVVAAGDVPVVPVERGGEATYHGPGQLVAYPIVALDGPRRDVQRHLQGLEQAVIDLLATLGVVAGRDARNTGVWVGGRKVCSIGIAVRRWVTWHGLALNVDVDLSGFARIRPCGFEATTMTRLADLLDAPPDVDVLADALPAHLVRTLGLTWDGARHRVSEDDRETAFAVATRGSVRGV